MEQGTLILTRKQVAGLLDLKECIGAVEEVFRLYGKGETETPGVLGVHAENGTFHIKAGALKLNRNYFVAKVNANFPNNKKLFGLPTIQGAIVLCNVDNGELLALMDTIEITTARTGAATAVAAKYLARGNSKTLSVIGCGAQGRISVRAMKEVFPIQVVHAFDIDEAKAQIFAAEVTRDLAIPVTASTTIAEAVQGSDICVTCTTSKQPVLKLADVPRGIFIAAVGADNEGKQELESTILANGKLVTDITGQCSRMGELHHAIEAGILQCEKVHAELGEVVAGKKRGRTSNEETTIFDSTGMALQDVATAAIIYERALAKHVGTQANLNG